MVYLPARDPESALLLADRDALPAAAVTASLAAA
jgi:hypothetical protein